jgi:hypothetical protein
MTTLLLSPVQIAFILLMLVTVTGAVMRGGPIERRGAALFFIGWTATLIAQVVTFGLTESLALFGRCRSRYTFLSCWTIFLAPSEQASPCRARRIRRSGPPSTSWRPGST